jgi:hypothetical protein
MTRLLRVVELVASEGFQGDDGGNTFLRDIGSYKSCGAIPEDNILHSHCVPTEPQILNTYYYYNLQKHQY